MQKESKPRNNVLEPQKRPLNNWKIDHFFTSIFSSSLLRLSGLSENTLWGFRLRWFTTHKMLKTYHNKHNNLHSIQKQHIKTENTVKHTFFGFFLWNLELWLATPHIPQCIIPFKNFSFFLRWWFIDSFLSLFICFSLLLMVWLIWDLRFNYRWFRSYGLELCSTQRYNPFSIRTPPRSYPKPVNHKVLSL